jgi:hypothetical protein
MDVDDQLKTRRRTFFWYRKDLNTEAHITEILDSDDESVESF